MLLSGIRPDNDAPDIRPDIREVRFARYLANLLSGTSLLSPLIFAVVVDVVTKHARKKLLNEILYADNLAPGTHPANFKGGGSKKFSNPHSGVDPENFGGGGKILN